VFELSVSITRCLCLLFTHNLLFLTLFEFVTKHLNFAVEAVCACWADCLRGCALVSRTCPFRMTWKAGSRGIPILSLLCFMKATVPIVHSAL
jgi:hypothetical protein